jgi:hypothetical protein
MAPEHALEQAIELGHGGTERLDRDRAEIELLRRHDPARLGPVQHALERRDRVLHMHEEEPAIGEVEGRALHRLDRQRIGCDDVEIGAAFAAEIGERLGAERGIDFQTRDAALRSNSVGHQPHHRARARADIEAAHAGRKSDAVETASVAFATEAPARGDADTRRHPCMHVTIGVQLLLSPPPGRLLFFPVRPIWQNLGQA